MLGSFTNMVIHRTLRPVLASAIAVAALLVPGSGTAGVASGVSASLDTNHVVLAVPLGCRTDDGGVGDVVCLPTMPAD
jgi:hypothetical protein